MKPVWKRALLSAVTVGLAVAGYAKALPFHRLSPKSTGSTHMTSQDYVSLNDALKQQTVDLQKQIKQLDNEVKQAQKTDTAETESLKKVQKQAVTLQKQLKAKQAAAKLAQERAAARAAAQTRQVSQKVSQPKVQSVTRASGKSDDDGGDSHDD